MSLLDGLRVSPIEFDGKQWIEWHKVPADQRGMPEPGDSLVEVQLMYCGKKIDYAKEFDWAEKDTRHAIGYYRRASIDEHVTEWTE